MTRQYHGQFWHKNICWYTGWKVRNCKTQQTDATTSEYGNITDYHSKVCYILVGINNVLWVWTA